jgi:hypothetical protein
MLGRAVAQSRRAAFDERDGRIGSLYVGFKLCSVRATQPGIEDEAEQGAPRARRPDCR